MQPSIALLPPAGNLCCPPKCVVTVGRAYPEPYSSGSLHVHSILKETFTWPILLSCTYILKLLKVHQVYLTVNPAYIFSHQIILLFFTHQVPIIFTPFTMFSYTLLSKIQHIFLRQIHQDLSLQRIIFKFS
jgi:hypothetical protein